MIRVLLVDDEPALCDITKIFLEREGDIAVTPSLSAEEALNIIEPEHFDVVVSDYEMPGMSGIDLLKALNARGLSVPVIIFTGRGREEVVIDALNNGAEYYLQKGGNPRLQFAELRHMILKAARNRLTEQTLADREAAYEKLFENMLNGVALHELILDEKGRAADYRFLAVNPAYEEITGLKADEIIGKTVRTVLADIEPEWIEDYARIALGGTAAHFERYSASLGKWFEIAAFSPGQGLFVTVVADITGRRKREKEIENWIRALERSEETYHTVVDNLQDVIFRADFSGNIAMISPSGAVLFGFPSPEEAKGANLVETAFPDPCIWDQMVAEIRDRGAVAGWEFALRGPEGNTVAMAANAHLWLDGAGTPIGIEGMMRDITWSRKARERLQASKDLLEGVFDGIKDVLAIQNPDHTIVRFNRAGYDLLNCTPEEVEGKKCYELIGRSEPCEVCATEMALNSKHLEEIERFFPELGKYFVCRSNPVLGDDGEVHLLIEQIADISERKRIETALQQANKKLNILNSITRHDILNWMTALLGYLEIEKDMVSDPSLLAIIEKEETAAVNIKRLITFTREYQDIGVNAPAWQDVERVVRSAFRHQDLNGATVEVSAGGLEVYADPMFVRVIENLIDNSVRHGEHVTAIRCVIERSESGVRFVYEDNGVGIPDDEKPRLFKQGYGKNTGFGLFLSKEILSITGLSIAEEGEPGRGARFVITIPPVACRPSGSGEV
jgi:PAS domain S-box-containing protein